MQLLDIGMDRAIVTDLLSAGLERCGSSSSPELPLLFLDYGRLFACLRCDFLQEIEPRGNVVQDDVANMVELVPDLLRYGCLLGLRRRDRRGCR